MSVNGANSAKPSSAKIVPVILSGGAGSRLWPLSRESFPKQLLPLTTERSLLQETADRIADRDMFAPPIVVCNAEHRFIIAEQLRQIGIDPEAIVLEPAAKNTAPAVAAAALMLAARQPDIQMLVLPSDHSIDDAAEFSSAVRTASFAASDGALVTFGIKPSRAETGYGYIQRGKRLGTREGCFGVEAFVEKPDAQTARSYLDAGGYDWNSGIFLFTAEAYLAELERFEPDIVAGCRAAVKEAIGVLARYGRQATPAQAGQTYKLLAKSNCRYASGVCSLENEDFKLRVTAAPSQGQEQPPTGISRDRSPSRSLCL